MPYIPPLDRIAVKPRLDYLLLYLNEHGYKPGLINYILTNILLYWWKSSAQNYETLNAIHGCLDCVGREFDRRVTGPYERAKAEENGDVFA